MSRLLLLLVLACWSDCVHGQGTVRLQPGQSYTLNFSALPFSHGLNLFENFSQGMFSVRFDYATVGEDDIVLLEMFEGNSSETPVASRPGRVQQGTYEWNAVGAWQDLQGAVRVTSLGGEFDIESIDVSAIRSVDLFNIDVYRQTFPAVPEPATWTLLGLGLTALVFFRRQGR